MLAETQAAEIIFMKYSIELTIKQLFHAASTRIKHGFIFKYLLLIMGFCALVSFEGIK
jgi:hypothetical protein